MVRAQTRKIRRKKIFLRVLLIFFLVILLCIGVAVAYVVHVIRQAPELDMKDVVPDGYRTTVLDDGGEIILTLIGEEANRVYVGLDQMPEHLGDAFIAIEDSRFWTHNGIDIRGILRAGWRDITSRSAAEGASTITQQLLKNNIFSEWMEEKTFWDKLERKIQEWYLAIQLEQNRSKEWILENYLNTINLGGGSWGVETASMRYFGKDVAQLNLSECCVLAAIPQSPTAYNPINYPEANRARRDTVLGKLLENGTISRAEYNRAIDDDVYTRIAENATGGEIQIFSYFEDAMLWQVLSDIETKLHYSEDAAWDYLYRGGLTIYTTQDTEFQRICEEQLNNDTLYTSDAQASCVLIDNATGQVKGIVGGRGEKEGSLTFNRAVDSVRQPGSTFKVVGEYATAMERGYATLGTVYDDEPGYMYATDNTVVHNSTDTYNGRTTVRQAIEESINVVAVKCFQEIGINAVWNTLEKFGFDHLTNQDKVEALALGGTHGGVTNLELTAAYAALANGGTWHEPVFYTKVLDRDGNVLLDRQAESRRVVSERTAALLTDAMQGVLTQGTGTAAWFEGSELAGKSGTTTDARDAWFVGYSPDYTCGIWGGYDDNSAQPSSLYVKNLWKGVMQQVQIYCTKRGFTMPDGIVSRKICTKCGKLAVDGLCDSTLQGDMTRTELYVEGTEPLDTCDCHVHLEICTVTNLPVARYCPSAYKIERIYLVSGTEGTADEDYVNPYGPDDVCTRHAVYQPDPTPTPSYTPSYPWDRQDDDDDNSNNTGDNSDSNTNGGSWWNWGYSDPTPAPDVAPTQPIPDYGDSYGDSNPDDSYGDSNPDDSYGDSDTSEDNWWNSLVGDITDWFGR